MTSAKAMRARSTGGVWIGRGEQYCSAEGIADLPVPALIRPELRQKKDGAPLERRLRPSEPTLPLRAARASFTLASRTVTMIDHGSPPMAKRERNIATCASLQVTPEAEEFPVAIALDNAAEQPDIALNARLAHS